MKGHFIKKKRKKPKKIDILVVSEFRIDEQMFSFTKIYKNLWMKKPLWGKILDHRINILSKSAVHW